ncbi:unnamed protein product [Fraxinus pennsylvanica]|uniref:Uncharacterized protein n=1 Tax=Fraxinus pennsylvanica TaxID=56036 RepID=A0AAD2AG18_9LAMI|nr:unnamed protein product [Fraxinus pennsylvanica]
MFADIKEFKKVVRNYGVMSRTNIRFKVNDAKRVQEDWYENDMISPITDKTLSEMLNKLVPQRRRNTMPTNQEQTSISQFMFMPTPEIVSSQSAIFNKVGLACDAPGISRDDGKGVASPKIRHDQAMSKSGTIFLGEIVEGIGVGFAISEIGEMGRLIQRLVHQHMKSSAMDEFRIENHKDWIPSPLSLAQRTIRAYLISGNKIKAYKTSDNALRISSFRLTGALLNITLKLTLD